MKKQELANRIENPMVDIGSIEVIIIERAIDKVIKTPFDEKEAYGEKGFSKKYLEKLLLDSLPMINNFIIILPGMGEVIILIDKKPTEEEILITNELLLDILPVSVSLEIHEIEFDLKELSKGLLQLTA